MEDVRYTMKILNLQAKTTMCKAPSENINIITLEDASHFHPDSDHTRCDPPSQRGF